MVPLALADSTVTNHPEVVLRMRAMAEANQPAGISAAQRGMAARADSTYILAAIDFPVLVIVGSEDRLTPVPESEALRDGIKGARFKVIEGAGHLSNMERPAEFNAALIEFIDSLKA
jgi:pimeloyl-ACP methyl ester carboxylesterase